MQPSRSAQPSLEVGFNTSYSEIVDGEFLRVLFGERLMTVHGGSWVTAASLSEVPGEVIARANYFHSGREECLIRLDAAIAQLLLFDRALSIRVAAPDSASAAAALNEVRTALPEVEGQDQNVPVRFWWWRPHYAEQMARMMPAPGWLQIDNNYGCDAKARLEAVMRWSGSPPAGGRLVLWHGPPGTGKTTAIRALAWEWRTWADLQFITDPEQFLGNPSYLLETISHRRSAAGRWRVLVLEDAGEYLAPDAKNVAGQALSRLLNVCDGVLGQATKSLVLVTANEPLRSLHPALSRPGRCLANVEFTELDGEEIHRWCEERDVERPQVTRASLAELYAHAEGRSIARRSPGFGFTQAA